MILGGLLAGVVIDAFEWLAHGFIFANDWSVVMQSLNRPATFSVKQLIALDLWGFLTGFAGMWLYAAIRPRFGAGPKTAVIAGAAMWFTNYALGGAFPVITHIFPRRLAAVSMLIGLVVFVVATLVGAAIYKEESQPLGRAAGV
jgi:hypothetical protein